MMKANKSDMSRRGFLGASLTGLASAGMISLAPRTLFAQEKTKTDKKKSGEIVYRTLGRTGYSVPVISMGVMVADAPAIVQAAYELGVRLFDTAANYQYGANEQMVGNVISKLGVRDKVYIVTKIFVPGQRQGLAGDQWEKKAVTLLEGSLKRLKTDYVDVLMVHDVSSADDINNPDMIAAMNKLKKQGKTRSIGLATHRNMTEVINEAARLGDYDVILTALNFTMADDSALISAIDNAASKGIGFIVMKALAGGSRWPNPDARANYNESTITKAALKWVLSNKNITTAIPGFANFDFMNEDFSVASNLEFTADEKKLLTDNNIKLSMGFCRQCEQCLASCPNDIDIPSLMRTHMYSAQYGDFYLARTTLDTIPNQKSLSVCNPCPECVAQCAHKSVDIARKIADLKLMYA
jgi:predicted aldo/keto reductase-like oxidoreductase